MKYVVTAWVKRPSDKYWSQVTDYSGAPLYWFFNKADSRIATHLRKYGYDNETMVRIRRWTVATNTFNEYEKTLGELYVK